MSQVPPGPAPGFPTPPNPYVQAPQQPGGQGSSSSKILWIVLGLVLVVALACGGILVALLFPAISAARGAAQRMSSQNNLKQISLALHSYHSTYKRFPPAYTTNSEGQRLHSWRTAILPFLPEPGAMQIHESIDWNKPWDDPANAVLRTRLSIYAPTTEGDLADMTTYMVIVDPESAFTGGPGGKGLRFQDMTDGTGSTILVVEGGLSQAVPWASPDDLTPDAFINPPADLPHRDGQNIALVDGSVQFITGSADPGLREALVTRSAGDVVVGGP